MPIAEAPLALPPIIFDLTLRLYDLFTTLLEKLTVELLVRYSGC